MKAKIDRAFYGQMLRLAVPIALQNMLSACGVLVDTAMVSGLGNISVAAVSVSARWNFILELFLFGFCSGAATLIAQYWGVRDEKSIRKTYLITLTLSVASSCILLAATRFRSPQMLRVFTDEQAVIDAAVPYLKILAFSELFLGISMATNLAVRAVGDVRSPLIASSLSVVINVVLNYGLIYGNLGLPRLGLQGAALATVIATLCQAVISLTLSLLHRSPVLPNAGPVGRLDWKSLRTYGVVALPVILNEGLWGLGTSGYTMVLARQGADNFAAYSIYNNVSELVFVFFVGLCSACGILLGHEIGAGRLEEGYKIARRSLVLCPFVGAVLAVAILLLKGPLLAVFPLENEETRQLISRLLTVFALILPLHNLPYTAITGVFRAGGDTRAGLLIDVFSIYCVGLPAVWYLGMAARVPFVALVAGMYLVEDSVKLIICWFYFRSRRWIRRLTAD